MKKPDNNPARWWRENFPNAAAREAADEAVDKPDVNRPMADFIDEWLAAYEANGGRRGTR